MLSSANALEKSVFEVAYVSSGLRITGWSSLVKETGFRVVVGVALCKTAILGQNGAPTLRGVLLRYMYDSEV